VTRAGTARRGAIPAAAVILVATVALIVFARQQSHVWPSWTLVVSAPHNSKEYYSAPVRPDDTFTLAYVHSVSNAPVIGEFRVTSSGMLAPVSTAFRAFGPGMPWTVGIAYERLADGSILVRHEEEPRDEIRLWVSPLTLDRFAVGDHEIDLTAGAEREVLVEIRVRR
jgi:hypothetical protein